MEARISDPVHLPDLEAHLRRLGCVTEVVGDDRLQVSIPDVPVREAAELELDLYLRLWEAKMPLAPAERIG